MRNPTIRKKNRKVVSALRTYCKSIESWAKLSRKTSKFHPEQANEFLLGVMLDRSVLADRAWDAGEWICEALGDRKNPRVLWEQLNGMEGKRLRGFLKFGYGGFAFHRHYKTFARLLPRAAKHILEKYNGDPRRIWNNQRNVDVVRDRFDAIPTIGSALSRMAVLILARRHGRFRGKEGRRKLDVKPDIHVKRVFQRCGFIPPRTSDKEVVEAARSLAPDFPASLDAPSFEIDRKFCRPTQPKCEECPITVVCPKLIRKPR